MNSTPPRILLVDDNADDRVLAERSLAVRIPGAVIATASDAQQFARCLEGRAPDLVISDYRLRWTDGFKIFEDAKARFANVPFIMFTGTGSEGIAVEAFKRGAADYVLKDREGYERLAAAAAAVLERVKDAAARRAAEARYQTLFNQIPVAVVEVSSGGRVSAVNPAALELFGYESAAAMIGIPVTDLYEDPSERARVLARLGDDGEAIGYELKLRRRSGAVFWAEIHFSRERKPDGTDFVRGAVIDISDRKRREEHEARIRAAEAKYKALLDELPVAIGESTLDGKILYANPANRQLFGFADDAAALADSAVDRWVDPMQRQSLMQELRRKGTAHVPAAQLRRADGSIFWAEIFTRLTEGDNGPTIRGVMIDISEKKSLEEQLRQSQKLEAIGQLTGGIAHDFNNLLTVIVGGAEALSPPLAGTPHAYSVEMIARAADRAAELTRRLLAFARRQMLSPGRVDPNRLVEGLVPLLKRTLGPNIAVAAELAAEAWPIHVDSVQLESALVNLALNARDAMPEGGRLVLATANAQVAPGDAGKDEIAPGEYSIIAVRDSGTGIAPEVLARVFEPFFTTKAIGVGTGLGLSQVHGFVKQSRGHVRIESRVGHGTEVKLYFPRLAHGADEAAAEAEAAPAPRGNETILLVEDDALVREILGVQIRKLGYHVVEVEDAAAALARVAAGGIDLLVSDIMLGSGMTGERLLAAVRAVRRKLPAVLISGYYDPALAARLKGEIFLAKPFSQRDLAVKLREALDRA